MRLNALCDSESARAALSLAASWRVRRGLRNNLIEIRAGLVRRAVRS
jgi:hypothetical protein